jgi:hypothetical protein
LIAKNITKSSATLTWSPVSGASTYTLQWKKSNSPTWTTVSGLTGVSYNLTSLAANTTYEFRVQTICAALGSVYSSAVSFKTPKGGRAAYTQAEEEVEFSIYPNPAIDKLIYTFSSGVNGNVRVSIYEVSGKKLMESVSTYEKGSTVLSVDVSALSTGIYIFEMENSEQTQRKQFYISR